MTEIVVPGTAGRPRDDVVSSTRLRGRAPAMPRAPVDRVTLSGWLLAFAAVLIAASASREMRIAVGSLLIHPVNLALLPLMLFLPVRLRQAPLAFLGGIVLFTACFAISAMVEPGGLDPTVKMVASSLTVIVAVIAIRTEADLRAAGTALALAAFLIGARAFATEGLRGLAGANPMEGIGNKNAYSIYALPGLLFAVHLVMLPNTSKRLKMILVPCIVGILFTLLSTANRSGWLGAIMIAGIFGLRAVRGSRNITIFVAVLALSGYVGSKFGNIEMLEHRIRQTQYGQTADSMRRDLIVTSFEIFLESPLMGVSPQRLGLELGRRAPMKARAYDSHNVFAGIIGGGGLLVLIPFVVLGLWLWRRPRAVSMLPATSPPRDAHFLLRAMVAVLVVRGLFTAEVLYNPAAALGLGAVVGLCNVRGVWRRALPRPGPRTRVSRPQVDRPGPS
ncbi:O-antigen ligase family protein [Myxococcota bacterium]|nr:O-antigen ligase family protein [Myxococcota bacterium]